MVTFFAIESFHMTPKNILGEELPDRQPSPPFTPYPPDETCTLNYGRSSSLVAPTKLDYQVETVSTPCSPTDLEPEPDVKPRNLDKEFCPPPAGVSQGALDRRVRRMLESNAKGQHKVCEQIRKMWEEGSKQKVFKLFMECNNDPSLFIKKYSIRRDHEKEFELGVFFEFKTEEELQDKSEKLCCKWFTMSL